MKKEDEKKGKVLDVFRSKYARSFFKKYMWSYISGILMLMLIDVVQTDVPLVVGNTIDFIAKEGFKGDVIYRQLVRLACIAAIVFVGRIAWRYLIFGSARKIERDMRNDLYAHLQKMPAGYFQEHKAGEIMAYISSDIETVRMVFAMAVVMGMDTLAIGVSTLIKMMTRIDVVLSAVSFIPMIFVAITAAVFGNELHKRYTLRQKAFSDLSDFVQERLNGIKVIKAFVQEGAENKAFNRANAKARDANIKEAKMQALMHPFMRLVAGTSMAIAIGYGGYIAIMGRISVGDFSGFLMFLNMLTWPMAAIGIIINVLTRGSASLKRLEKVLNAEPGISDISGVKPCPHIEGSIEARGLTFRYPGTGKDVLRNISFKLNKGETLGIVGRTGAGKTTLASLLLRVFEPDDDMLYIGGHEIHSIPLKQLRQTIGYVPQDNFLFSDTVSANIAFGDRKKTMDEVMKAAKAARVHDNIIEFGEGYDTMVGERGVSLSGGQKQRIAIARALILDPEIIIFDDSVSAVDTDTEEQILENLRTLRRGKTNIIIAHRISTLQDADRIIVIDGGRIAEEGTHPQLVKAGGIYADMYRRQLLEKMKQEKYAI